MILIPFEPRAACNSGRHMGGHHQALSAPQPNPDTSPSGYLI